MYKRHLSNVSILTIILFLLVSCSDDSNNGGPTDPGVNQPPSEPSDPFPADGRGNYPVDFEPMDIELTWKSVDPDEDPVRFDLYLGLTEDPPLVEESIRQPAYQPAEFDPNTIYYWKVVARDSLGNTVEGPIWSFSTGFKLGGADVYCSMVWLEPDTFEMGASQNETGAKADEYPRHTVTLNSGFWMAWYEVTQEQWGAIMGGIPSRNFGAGDNFPVYYVSWVDIQDFINRLNGEEGSDIWRLPTEAEWEYACRAGTSTRFYWGDDPAYDHVDDYSWNSLNSSGMAHEVGLKQPNPFGLFDMCGNVCEWVYDDYHENYNGAPDDGSAWEIPESGTKALRGGASGNYEPEDYRSAARFNDVPAGRNISYGFRLVREVDINVIPVLLE